MPEQKSRLYYILTRIDPSVRRKALARVANKNQVIHVGEWCNGRRCCLFVVMAEAALGRPLDVEEMEIPIIAQILGLTPEEVAAGVKQWDAGGTRWRRKLRCIDIPAYLATYRPDSPVFTETSDPRYPNVPMWSMPVTRAATLLTTLFGL